MANRSDIKAGGAFVEITANDSKLQAGLKRAGERLKTFGKAVAAVGAGLAAIGSAVTVPFAAMAHSFAESGSALADMSKRTGFTAEQLSELKYGAEQTGASLEGLEAATRSMSRNILAAASGNKSAAETFAILGLNVKEIMALSPADQFKAIGDAISRIPDPSLRAGLAMKAFGKSGTQLLPLLEKGAAGMDEFAARAKRLGLVMTSDMAENADALGDSMDDLGSVVKFTGNAIGNALAPILTKVSETLTFATVEINKFITANKELVVTVFKVGAVVAATGTILASIGGSLVGVGLALKVASAAVGVATSTFGILTAALGALLSPIGIVTAGLAGLAGYLIYTSGVGGKALTWLSDRFIKLKDDATAAFKGISDALAGGDIALAARVLWLTLKVEFEKGAAALAGPIQSVKRITVVAFAETWAEAKRLWIEFQNFFESNFPNFTATIEKAWASFAANMASIWESVQKSVSDGFIHIIALGDDSFNEADALKANQKQSDDRQLEITRQEAADRQEAERRRTRSPQQVADERRAALKQIKDDLNKDIEAADAAAATSIQNAADDLARTKAELAEAQKTAAAERKAAEDAAASSPQRQQRDIKDIFAGISETISRTIGVQGTFNALAARGLGSGGASDRLEKAAEQSVDIQKRMLDELQNMDGAEFE